MPIAVTTEADVACLTLSYPPANAMGGTFFSDLSAALDAAKDARAIVLEGSGNSFSVGLDLPALLALDRKSVRALIGDFSATMQKLFLWPRPTVAALNGHTVAGGLILASACDFRLAAVGAGKVGMTGVALGVAYPALAVAILQHSVPPQLWHTVLLEGRLFAVADAHGIVDRLIAPTELRSAALAFAAELGKSDARAYARTKLALKKARLQNAQLDADASHDAFAEGLFEPETRARLEAAVRRLKDRSTKETQ